MTHDVFISYSSLDKTAAETVCSILEQNGLSCWIAPRDITPGLDFAESIIDGIKSSKLFILVYSTNSNNSKQVIREVDRAVHTGLPVINLRLDDVPLSKQLEYYLSSVHWLDAMTPPLEEHMKTLSGVVLCLLRKGDVGHDDLKKAIRDGTLRVGQDKKSIAVLPFINDSHDQENTYFINGVMEEILNNLQKIKDLRVISRTSVEQYRDKKKPISEIAQELGVKYIVEGSGQKYGNSFRLRAQLIMAEHESHLWGESFQQKINNVEDIFNIQIRIAESIAEELKAVISPEEKRLIEKIPTADLEVYDKYLKARSYWSDFTKESLFKAVEYLNSAVDKNPDWAPLYAGLAEVWIWIQQAAWETPSVAGPKIVENLNKAMELDPDLAEVHYQNAVMAQLVEWDWGKSEKGFLKSLAINPNNPLARLMYAQLLLILNRSDESIAQRELAISLDPLNPVTKLLYIGTLVQAGDCTASLPLFEEALIANPEDLNLNGMLELAAYKCKDYDKVIRSLKYGLPFPFEEEKYKEIKRIYEVSGIVPAYEKLMKYLEKYAGNNYIGFSDMAFRHIIANQPDKAMNWIEKGFELHDPIMTYITRTARFFEPLFGNPRFIAICEKMNLPLPKN
ncbi:MAG: TIR domain-containing protein [Bacteroidales bacterium]